MDGALESNGRTPSQWTTEGLQFHFIVTICVFQLYDIANCPHLGNATCFTKHIYVKEYRQPDNLPVRKLKTNFYNRPLIFEKQTILFILNSLVNFFSNGVNTTRFRML